MTGAQGEPRRKLAPCQVSDKCSFVLQCSGVRGFRNRASSVAWAEEKRWPWALPTVGSAFFLFFSFFVSAVWACSPGPGTERWALARNQPMSGLVSLFFFY